MELNGFASLPEQLQVILVSGYLGYSIAYAGYRDKERKDQLFYGILAFGIFGYIFWDATRQSYDSFLVPGLGALLISVVAAIFWRKYGRYWFNHLMHKAAISNEDGIDTTWNRILQDTRICPTQIDVYLKDGSVLRCDEVEKFIDAPIPLFYADAEGNLALYITRNKPAGGETVDVEGVRDSGWGDRITYLPKDQISRVSIRFVKKKASCPPGV